MTEPQDLERRAFAYFRKPYTEDYRRLAVAAVVRILQSSARAISIQEVKRQARYTYNIECSAVDDAINALNSPLGFNCVKKRKATHAILVSMPTVSDSLTNWINHNKSMMAH